MRGEKLSAPALYLHPVGSPPHARGKARRRRLPGLWTGITPACAGKSSWAALEVLPKGDHPRMRGEKRISVFIRHLLAGSPPHARGKGSLITFTTATMGITPACAGKSVARRVSNGSKEDHPRMRGEKIQRGPIASDIEGSPPHARGKAVVFTALM